MTSRAGETALPGDWTSFYRTQYPATPVLCFPFCVLCLDVVTGDEVSKSGFFLGPAWTVPEDDTACIN